MCKPPPILETHSRLVNMKDVLEAPETCIVSKTSLSFSKSVFLFSIDKSTACERVHYRIPDIVLINILNELLIDSQESFKKNDSVIYLSKLIYESHISSSSLNRSPL